MFADLAKEIEDKVIVPLSLGVEAQEIVNTELEWLFAAAEHVLKIQQGGVERTAPVPVGIPPEAQTSDQANNIVLAYLDEACLQVAGAEIERLTRRANIYLENLVTGLDNEAEQRRTAAPDVASKRFIKKQRLAMIGYMQQLARLMQHIYGVMVYSPHQLAKLLR